MIFDTHVHLNDDYYSDLKKVIKEANSNDVSAFLCVGYDLDSSKKAIEIASKYDNVFASIGIIPTEHKQYNKDAINELKKLLTQSSKIKAIGEIGLDYYWENSEEVKDIQKEMFIEQIKLANEYDLPISIHCRDAIEDTLNILKEYKVNKGGIMHCYSGSLESAKEFIKLGFYIAFGGVLTFKNSIKTKEVIKGISVDKIVFETDAPYLTPTPYRGKKNEPKFILETVKYASSLLNMPLEELENITFNNSLKILHVSNNEIKIR